MVDKIYKIKKKYNLSLFRFILFAIAVMFTKKRYFKAVHYIYIILLRKNPSIELKIYIGLFYFHHQNWTQSNKVFSSIEEYKKIEDENLAYIILAAAYNNNLSDIEKIISSDFEKKSIKRYAEAFLEFSNKNIEDSSVLYCKAVEEFEKENDLVITMKDNIPNHIRYAINVIDMNIDVLKFEYFNYFEQIEETFFSKKDEPFILISLEVNYLKIFSDFTITKIRKKHDNQIHFNVVISCLDEKKEIIEICNKLDKNYKNVSYSIVLTKYNKALVSALSRFKIVLNLVKKYSLTGVILDADSNFESVDLIELEKRVGQEYDCSLFIYEEPVLWAKYPANACIFRNTKDSFKILEYCDKYYSYFIRKDKAFWTIDQTALFFAFYVYNKIKFFNLSILEDPKKMHYKIPKEIENKKIQIKSKNL